MTWGFLKLKMACLPLWCSPQSFGWVEGSWLPCFAGRSYISSCLRLGNVPPSSAVVRGTFTPHKPVCKLYNWPSSHFAILLLILVKNMCWPNKTQHDTYPPGEADYNSPTTLQCPSEHLYYFLRGLSARKFTHAYIEFVHTSQGSQYS